MAKLTPEQQKAMIAADPEYLRATLHAIDAKYGSFDNYRRTELHVSDADAQTLRNRLLTNYPNHQIAKTQPMSRFHGGSSSVGFICVSKANKAAHPVS
jgi:hypothetical protein